MKLYRLGKELPEGGRGWVMKGGGWHCLMTGEGKHHLVFGPDIPLETVNEICVAVIQSKLVHNRDVYSKVVAEKFGRIPNLHAGNADDPLACFEHTEIPIKMPKEESDDVNIREVI